MRGRFLKKLSIELPDDLAITLLGLYLIESSENLYIPPAPYLKQHHS